MKNKKFAAFRANGDVAKIDIDLTGAAVTVTSTAEPELYIEYSKGLRPVFCERDGAVTVKQRGGLFAKLRRPVINVYVPECTVPDLCIDAERGNIYIDGGIFGDAAITGGMMSVKIDGAIFENLRIEAAELDVCAGGMTVKNLANTIAADGRVEIEKTFCKKAECRLKKGNIGLCGAACDFAVLNSEDGSIYANMLGSESDYTIALDAAAVSGCGNTYGGDKFIRARAAKGNIVLDFEHAPRFDEAEELGEYEELHA